MSRKFGGLDLGTRTGWAVLNEDGSRSASGAWNCKPSAGSSPGMRFIIFRRNLSELLAAYGDISFGYEDVKQRPLSVAAGHTYGGFKAHMLEIFDSLDITYCALGVGEIKSHATGKGQANKGAMCRAASIRWPDLGATANIDDNEADALHTASLMLARCLL